MSTIAEGTSRQRTPAASERLRATMAAVRVMFVWFGVRKTLTPEQKSQAADAFGAEGTFLSAGKKLLDTSHSAFKAVTAVRGRILNFWKGISLPYSEPAMRLIRQDDVGTFQVQLSTLQAELAEAVQRLDEHYSELKTAARQRLGQLYNAGDYPNSLSGLFAVNWDFPSVEPPAYLQQLSPALYRQECERMQARFGEAVELAEKAFTEELAKLVSHLTERLAGSEDGKPKVFRDSAIENLSEFFDKFKHLNVGSSEKLDELVEQARKVIRGVEPQQLRDNDSLRQTVATRLAAVSASLDGLMVDRPRRNILRRPR
ncbi:MAG: hypothetical protein AB7F89_17960 [Pirellulaceae bacterium]